MKAPYIIAETAYSFEGSKDYLLESIVKLPNAVSAVKFHLLFNIDEYVVAAYTGLKELLQKWVLSENDWMEILSKTKKKGKDVIVLADDLNTITYLEEHVDLVDGIEVHAACVNDIYIFKSALEFAHKYRKRFYLGISGFEFYELKKIIPFIRQYDGLNIILMYGFQNYPTKIENLQMNKIEFYRTIFDCEIGYADHTQADLEVKDDIICAAYAAGTNVLEIHYVNTFCEKRTDSITAYDAEHLSILCKKIENIRVSFGEFEIELNEGELNYLNFRKVPVYSRKIEAGHVLEEKDILFKRVEKATERHSFMDFVSYLGKKTIYDVDKDSEIMNGELVE